MQGGIETHPRGYMVCSTGCMWSTQDMGLRTFPQSGLGEFLHGELRAISVHGQVNGAERTPTNLLLDDILVDAVYCPAIVLAIGVFGMSVQGLFDFSRARLMACVMSQRAFICRRGSKDVRKMTSRITKLNGKPYTCLMLEGRLGPAVAGRSTDMPWEGTMPYCSSLDTLCWSWEDIMALLSGCLARGCALTGVDFKAHEYVNVLEASGLELGSKYFGGH